MLPVVAIVGRPNVGKSTLFNALTGTRDAIVADQPGVTRDRQYGIFQFDRQQQALLVDTGGIMADAKGLDELAMEQVKQALADADIIIFLVDARAGVTAGEREILSDLRRLQATVLLVANKTDGMDWEIDQHEWYELGLGPAMGVAASHRRGLDSLRERVADEIAGITSVSDNTLDDLDERDAIKLAFIGRPNVGKSTLVNRLLGEQRVLASDTPGTTRDSIRIPLVRDEQRYILIDTAGVRRRAKVHENVESISVIKTLQSVQSADIAVVMLDAHQGLADQDSHLIGQVLQLGTPLVIALNKWDGLEKEDREMALSEMQRRLTFVDFVRKITISALHGSGLRELFNAIKTTHEAANKAISSNQLTAVLRKAVEAHQPPLHQGRTARLRYAHVGGRGPLRIVIHGSKTKSLPGSYHRYLLNVFRKHFKLTGVAVVLDFRDGDNPFAGRKNTLTSRQQEKRKRLKKFTQRRRGR